MNSQDFAKFIQKEHKRLLKSFPCDKMDKETFARTVKMNEEVGELNEAILKYFFLKKSKEAKAFTKRDLEDEFADVVITTFLLAERMKVDLWQALENKVEKIKKRKY